MKFQKLVYAFVLIFSLAVGTGTVAISSEDNAHEHTFAHQLVEIQPSDFKPAFTRDTVIKLNSIVERAYSAIGEFDELKNNLKSSSEVFGPGVNASQMLSEDQLASIRSLKSRSSIVLSDMNVALEVLKVSGEHYNPAVLAGMVIFVKTVEEEITRFYRSSSAL